MPRKKAKAEDPPLKAAVDAAGDKKAEEITVMDLRGLSDVADYFLVCHGRSSRQVQSIADSIEQALLALKRRPNHIEGYARGEWILMDYIDLVVHIFTAERREYYGLERLWGDAPRIALDGGGRAGRLEAAAGGKSSKTQEERG